MKTKLIQIGKQKVMAIYDFDIWIAVSNKVFRAETFLNEDGKHMVSDFYKNRSLAKDGLLMYAAFAGDPDFKVVLMSESLSLVNNEEIEILWKEFQKHKK